MHHLGALLTLAAVPALLIIGAIIADYWFLALVALTHRRTAWRSKGVPATCFAILVPAHNEAGSLPRTLRSCFQQDYPRNLYSVHVVADNCSDPTQQVAIDHGAQCYVRHDQTRRGKGHALAFGFERISLENYDAVVILDADCELDRHALGVFDSAIVDEVRVLQANDVASNPDESSTSLVLAIGNYIENELFYRPRSELGRAVLLRGTGMVLHKEILAAHPWRAHSVSEDVEYSIALARGGVAVRFVHDAAVRSPYPASARQLQVQRTRWAGGTLGFAKREALGLLWEGVRTRDIGLADVAWTLLVLSRPVLVLGIGLSLLMSMSGVLLAPSPLSFATFHVSLGLVVLFVAYCGLGVFGFGLTNRRLRLLLGLPVVALRLLVISVMGLLGGRGDSWERTPR